MQCLEIVNKESTPATPALTINYVTTTQHATSILYTQAPGRYVFVYKNQNLTIIYKLLRSMYSAILLQATDELECIQNKDKSIISCPGPAYVKIQLLICTFLPDLQSFLYSISCNRGFIDVNVDHISSKHVCQLLGRKKIHPYLILPNFNTFDFLRKHPTSEHELGDKNTVDAIRVRFDFRECSMEVYKLMTLEFNNPKAMKQSPRGKCSWNTVFKPNTVGQVVRSPQAIKFEDILELTNFEIPRKDILSTAIEQPVVHEICEFLNTLSQFSHPLNDEDCVMFNSTIESINSLVIDRDAALYLRVNTQRWIDMAIESFTLLFGVISIGTLHELHEKLDVTKAEAILVWFIKCCSEEQDCEIMKALQDHIIFQGVSAMLLKLLLRMLRIKKFRHLFLRSGGYDVLQDFYISTTCEEDTVMVKDVVFSLINVGTESAEKCPSSFHPDDKLRPTGREKDYIFGNNSHSERIEDEFTITRVREKSERTKGRARAPFSHGLTPRQKHSASASLLLSEECQKMARMCIMPNLCNLRSHVKAETDSSSTITGENQPLCWEDDIGCPLVRATSCWDFEIHDDRLEIALESKDYRDSCEIDFLLLCSFILVNTLHRIEDAEAPITYTVASSINPFYLKLLRDLHPWDPRYRTNIPQKQHSQLLHISSILCFAGGSQRTRRKQAISDQSTVLFRRIRNRLRQLRQAWKPTQTSAQLDQLQLFSLFLRYSKDNSDVAKVAHDSCHCEFVSILEATRFKSRPEIVSNSIPNNSSEEDADDAAVNVMIIHCYTSLANHECHRTMQVQLLQNFVARGPVHQSVQQFLNSLFCSNYVQFERRMASTDSVFIKTCQIYVVEFLTAYVDLAEDAPEKEACSISTAWLESILFAIQPAAGILGGISSSVGKLDSGILLRVLSLYEKVLLSRSLNFSRIGARLAYFAQILFMLFSQLVGQPNISSDDAKVCCWYLRCLIAISSRRKEYTELRQSFLELGAVRFLCNMLGLSKEKFTTMPKPENKSDMNTKPPCRNEVPASVSEFRKILSQSASGTPKQVNNFRFDLQKRGYDTPEQSLSIRDKKDRTSNADPDEDFTDDELDFSDAFHVSEERATLTQPKVPLLTLRPKAPNKIKPPSQPPTVSVAVNDFRKAIVFPSRASTTSRSDNVFTRHKPLYRLSICLMLHLLVSPDNESLDDWYCSQFPENSTHLHMNVLHFLHEQINSGLGKDCVMEILEMSKTDVAKGVQRLLRLLSVDLFGGMEFKQLRRISRGAFGTVYECTILQNSTDVKLALKLLERPRNSSRRCVLFDVFSEVAALERLQRSPGSVQMFNFGVTDEQYYIVLEYCETNLKEWREGLQESTSEAVLCLLDIFEAICECVQEIHKSQVVHCDLKCENILVRHRFNPGTFDASFICIGDYGEAIDLSCEDYLHRRSRGTEGIKSPEMLLMGNGLEDPCGNGKPSSDSSSRITKATDIWSLGTLLYELCTGDFLFQSENWGEYFTHVTKLSRPVLNESAIHKLSQSLQTLGVDNATHVEYLEELITFMLRRNVSERPTIDQLCQKLDGIRTAIKLDLGGNVSTGDGNSDTIMTCEACMMCHSFPTVQSPRNAFSISSDFQFVRTKLLNELHVGIVKQRRSLSYGAMMSMSHILVMDTGFDHTFSIAESRTIEGCQHQCDIDISTQSKITQFLLAHHTDSTLFEFGSALLGSCESGIFRGLTGIRRHKTPKLLFLCLGENSLPYMLWMINIVMRKVYRLPTTEICYEIARSLSLLSDRKMGSLQYALFTRNIIQERIRASILRFSKRNRRYVYECCCGKCIFSTAIEKKTISPPIPLPDLSLLECSFWGNPSPQMWVSGSVSDFDLLQVNKGSEVEVISSITDVSWFKKFESGSWVGFVCRTCACLTHVLTESEMHVVVREV